MDMPDFTIKRNKIKVSEPGSGSYGIYYYRKKSLCMEFKNSCNKHASFISMGINSCDLSFNFNALQSEKIVNAYENNYKL